MKVRKTFLAAAMAMSAVFFAMADDDPLPPLMDESAPPQSSADGASEQKGKCRELLRERLDQFKGGRRMQPPPPDADFGGMKKFLEQSLSEDERHQLRKLAFDNPDSFREELKAKYTALHKSRQEEMQKFSGFQKSYREAKTPEEKSAALEQIRSYTKEQFAKKMELNKARLEEAERKIKEASKRLEDYRKKYEARKSRADEIVEERVKELVKDPELQWRD